MKNIKFTWFASQRGRQGFYWLGCFFYTLALSLPVAAGDFGVSPIRIDLDRSTKTGATSVQNGEADSLRAQLQLFEWTQDATGKDQYQKSEDLLYFPKVMSLNKSEQKLIRVALRLPATTQEKTYRLFIEELPAPPPKGSAGTKVTMAVRFGVPVFVKPVQENVQGKIEQINLSKGVLHFIVHNVGNVHFAIKSLTASSGADFSKTINGWYLLAGVAREYTIPIPANDCKKLKAIDITVSIDASELKSTYNVNQAQCT